VSWHKVDRKWLAKITEDGKQTHLGSFNDEDAAARAYDEAAARLGRPLNFQTSDVGPRAVKGKRCGDDGTSRHRGVTWDKRDKKWRAAMIIDGKRISCGYFDDEDAAARAIENKEASLRETSNLPAAASFGGALGFLAANGDANAAKSGLSSNFRGVSWDKEKNKWKAQTRIDGKISTLGRFHEEEAAARAYDEVAAQRGMPMNFPADGEVSARKGGGGSASSTSTSSKKRPLREVESLPSSGVTSAGAPMVAVPVLAAAHENNQSTNGEIDVELPAKKIIIHMC
jgi:hypothetical protein